MSIDIHYCLLTEPVAVLGPETETETNSTSGPSEGDSMLLDEIYDCYIILWCIIYSK